jgi:hypothetical protein
MKVFDKGSVRNSQEREAEIERGRERERESECLSKQLHI